MELKEEDYQNYLEIDTVWEEGTKHSWSESLPPEIVVFIFKFLDCKSLTKVALTNTYWHELFTSKDIQKWFKNECFEIFDRSGVYSATKKYMTHFKDWKNMFIYRPRIRWDGVYFSKVEYWHDGLVEFGDINPVHKVVYYIFLCFTSDGKMCHGASHLEPDIFLEKLKFK